MIFVERKCWILTFKVGYTFFRIPKRFVKNKKETGKSSQPGCY